jgi:hypothetical protein
VFAAEFVEDSVTVSVREHAGLPENVPEYEAIYDLPEPEVAG